MVVVEVCVDVLHAVGVPTHVLGVVALIAAPDMLLCEVVVEGAVVDKRLELCKGHTGQQQQLNDS